MASREKDFEMGRVKNAVLGRLGCGCRVNIENRQGRYLIDFQTRMLIRRAVYSALKYEHMCMKDFPVSVSVSIVNDRQTHRLNKKYRGIDSSTDVLSFPLLEDGCPTPDDIDYDSGCIPLGDIVISIDHAVMQARDYGHSLRREIAFLCVHSVLHLLGYDHVTSDEDERIMFDKQREILGSMGITR